MTIKEALTYRDGHGRPFFWEDYDFGDVARFIGDELECDGGHAGEDIEAVAEDMANGDMDIPSGIADGLHEAFENQAWEWRHRKPESDEWDALGL